MRIATRAATLIQASAGGYETVAKGVAARIPMKSRELGRDCQNGGPREGSLFRAPLKAQPPQALATAVATASPSLSMGCGVVATRLPHPIHWLDWG